MKRFFIISALITASFVGGAISSHWATAKTAESSPFFAVEQFARVLTLVENEYVDPIDRSRLVQGAIKGMVAELDPHSSYLPAEDYALFHSETEGKFGGVGIEVEVRNERVVVVVPFENTPAERAGVKSGDVITAIEGESTRDVPLDQLVRKMRGAPGSKVQLTILSPGSERSRTLNLTREEIKVMSVTGKRLRDDVAYLRIKQFQEETHEQFLKILGQIRKESDRPLRGILLDVRNNPGGLVDSATAIADELLASGTIYTTRQHGHVVEEAHATPGGAFTKGPVAVLVNEYSASASELLAGALQDNKRARVIGATTFGKGSVQTLLELPGGAALKLTTMRYATPSGRLLQAIGITPDLTVEPTGVPTAPSQIVRERDLQGHLSAEGGPAQDTVMPKAEQSDLPNSNPQNPAASQKPGAVDETDFGVAKKIPFDPTAGPDHVLSVAYQLVKTESQHAP